jgi:hypothetical protein
VADRSRDADTGRFTQTQKPEPLFAPRPIEGDELTGDTNDGGDDARLKSNERRIADGWSDEGENRQSPQRHAARSRQTAAEAEGPSGERRLAEPGAGDVDAAAADGHQGAEGEPGDGEAEAAGDEEDKDAPRYEVNVDGQTMEVSLPEALKGYIREQTFHQRMSQVDQARQSVQQEAQNAVQFREAYQEKLRLADRLIAELTPPEPDWDKEYEIDPRRAREHQKAFQEVYGKRAWIQEEHARSQAEATQEYDARARDYAINEFSQFVRESNIPDKPTLDQTLQMMRDYGVREGFSESELATTYDRRMLRVLRKAALYDQSMANRPKAVPTGAGKTLIPGSATPIGNAPRRHIDGLQKQLAKTGRLDDAALVFKQILK